MLRDMIKRGDFKQKLVTIGAGDSVASAARLMEKKNVGCLLVLTDGKPRGLITDRDIVVRCIAKNIDVDDCTVENIISESVVLCNDTDGFYDALKTMHDHGIRRVPIVDDSGKAVGILTFSDAVGIIGKELSMLVSLTAIPEGEVGPEEEKAA